MRQLSLCVKETIVSLCKRDNCLFVCNALTFESLDLKQCWSQGHIVRGQGQGLDSQGQGQLAKAKDLTFKAEAKNMINEAKACAIQNTSVTRSYCKQIQNTAL